MQEAIAEAGTTALPPGHMPALIKRARGAESVGLGVLPRPIPGPGEAVIEVHATGICGTDLHIVRDEYPSDPPVVMGHETTGRVVEVGEGAEGFLGKRVSPETFFYTCDVCDACRAGRRNLCLARRSIGSHVDGAFATHVLVPAGNLHEVHASVGDHAGALYEPLSCIAQSLCDPAGGFDVVADCSGAERGIDAGLRALRRGGRYVQIGLVGRPVTFDIDLVCLREITITAGFASTPRSWRRLERLIDAGHVVLDPLVTDVVPLSAWEEAFARTGRAEGLKIVLDPRMDAA